MSEPEIQQDEVTEANVAEVDVAQTNEPVRDAEDDVLDRLFASRDDEPAPAVETKADPAPSKDRERLAAILKRDGVPDEVISTVSEDTLQAWADKASKRQKDVDGYGKKMAELEKQLQSGKKPEPAPEVDSDLEDDVDDDTEPSPKRPADAQEDPFSEIEELLGEDAARPIRDMRAELAELRKMQQQTAEQSLLAQVDSADAYFRSQYGTKAPEREAVIAEMNRLGAANPGTYKSVMHLADEAYANLAGRRTASEPRKVGQPTVARTVSRSERPKTPVDAEDAILEALLEGKTRDEAIRLIRK
jgi:hypothetical protein